VERPPEKGVVAEFRGGAGTIESPPVQSTAVSIIGLGWQVACNDLSPRPPDTAKCGREESVMALGQ